MQKQALTLSVRIGPLAYLGLVLLAAGHILLEKGVKTAVSGHDFQPRPAFHGRPTPRLGAPQAQFTA